MKLEKRWTASSADLQVQPSHDLTEVAGMWTSQLSIRVANPATIQNGSLEHHLVSEVSEADKNDLTFSY